MNFAKAIIVPAACSILAAVSGCYDYGGSTGSPLVGLATGSAHADGIDYDEDGVDYERAGRTGYARLTFRLLPRDASSERLWTVHHLYLDQSVTIPGAATGPERYVDVPSDRGALAYRIALAGGSSQIDIVDRAQLEPDGTPVTLFTFRCHGDEVGAGIWTTFDSPNRGDDGSFVRIQVVDPRHAFCAGSGP